MQVTEIPFVKLIGIEQEKNNLSLRFDSKILNHIKTIHASAQFTLAETQSGLFLQELFHDLEKKVIPVLRDSQIKFKKPAVEMITAYSKVSEDIIIKFKEQFTRKNRGTIQIEVDIKDINGLLTSQAVFTWFIQKI